MFFDTVYMYIYNIYIYIFHMYMYINTHTHTHIYIYIYTYLDVPGPLMAFGPLYLGSRCFQAAQRRPQADIL